MLSLVWLLPALMAGAFVVTLFFGKRLPYKGAEVGTAAIVISFVLSIIAVVQWVNRPQHEELREPVRKITSWYRDGNVNIGLGLHVDGYTVAMLFVVAFISLTVHIFSIEYLRDDIRFTHYFASLNLFTAAMFCSNSSGRT